VTDQRLAAPILGDVGEQPMLDPVLLAGPGRQMRHGHGQACLVGEALQFALPQPDPRAVASATIGGDDQPLGLGVAGLAKPVPPAPDALDREGGRIGLDPDTDPALVGSEVGKTIVDTVWPNGLAGFTCAPTGMTLPGLSQLRGRTLRIRTSPRRRPDPRRMEPRLLWPQGRDNSGRESGAWAAILVWSSEMGQAWPYQQRQSKSSCLSRRSDCRLSRPSARKPPSTEPIERY
jgi:hypothetical protein